MSEDRQKFAAAVRRVLDEHGLNKRSQRIRTGIDHVTLDGMLTGVRPRMETVVRFAQGFGLDVGEWLTLAGYDPIPSDDSPSPAEALLAGLRALDAEFGQPVMFSTEDVRGEPLTHARVTQILAAIREKLESRRGSTPPASGTPRKRPNGPGGGQQLAAAW